MAVEAEAGRQKPIEAAAPTRAPLEELARLVECLRGGRAVLVAGTRLLRGAALRPLLEDAAEALPESEREEARVIVARSPLLAARFLRRRLAADPLVSADPPDAASMLLDLPFRARIDATDPHEARRAIEPLWPRSSFLFAGFDVEDPEWAALVEATLPPADGDGPEHFAVLAGAGPLEREALWAAHRIRVLAERDPLMLAQALRDALGTDAEDFDAQERRLRWAEDYDALVELYVARIGVEPSAERRAALLESLARLFRFELSDLNKAFAALLVRYREVPQREAWEPLAELAAATGRWDELLRELEASASDLPAADRAEALVLVARHALAALGDPARALAAAQGALAADPTHDDALAMRIDLLRNAERFPELCEALEARAEQDPSLGARTALLVEAAEIAETRLADVARAAERYRRALAADPWFEPARLGLEALLRRHGRDAELVPLLDEKLGHAPDDEQVAIRRELGALCEKLGDSDGAIARWEELRAQAPADSEALRALERLYEKKGAVRELAEVLAAQSGILEDRLERATLYRRLAVLWEQQVGDRERAAECVEWLLALEGPNDATFRDLERIYRADMRWRAAIDVHCRHAATVEPPQRAVLYIEVAGIFERELRDPARATDFYLKAEEAVPGHAMATAHVPALTALAEIHRQRGELLEASQMLSHAAEHAEAPNDRSRLKMEAARLREIGEDRSGAIPLYLDAAKTDPDHVEAADRASELLWKKGRFRDMLPILELLVRKPATPQLALHRWMRLAEAATRAGAREKAEKAWSRAVEISPDHPAALRGRAELATTEERWADAEPDWLRLREKHGASADVAFELVRCAAKLGHLDDAHLRLAAAMPLLHDLAPGETTITLLCDAVDVAAETDAVALLEEGLALAPDHHRLLHRALDLRAKRKEWDAALAILSRLIELEQDRPRRARYREAAGFIELDELGRTEAGLARLDLALEDDPGLERSAQVLEAALRERRAFTTLANHFYRLLEHLGPENGDGRTPARKRAWAALGELCLGELGDRAAAQVALEAAVRLDPADLDRRERLAGLYLDAGPDAIDRAILMYQEILRDDATRRGAYGALAQLYARAGRAVQARACEAALAVLEGRAPPSGAEPVAPRRPLDADDWGRLRHPSEDRLLGALLGRLAPFVAGAQAQPRKQLGLLQDDAVAPDDERPFAHALRQVAQTLGVVPPEAHVRREQMQPLLLALCRTRTAAAPVLLVGLPMLGDRRDAGVLFFHGARLLARLRPDRIVSLLAPQPQALARLVEAAMSQGSAAEQTQAGLRRALPSGDVDQIMAIGERLRARGLEPEPAVRAWLAAADATATRVALALVGDVATCARLLDAEPATPATLPREKRIADLLAASISDDLLAVRERLGTLSA